MLRGALRAVVFVLTLAACARALAHGGAPIAFAVLDSDAMGPRAVSFNTGVALRRAAQRFQFVCPAAWGDQFTSPMAALPQGQVVLGAARGLMLLDDAGVTRAHPDPAAVGRTVDLVQSPAGVFSLRPAAAGSEVLAVDALSVRVLWKDPANWTSMAAVGDTLVLVSANNRLVERVVISARDGVEIERQSASVDYPVDFVFARGSYVLVVFRNGTMALGSLNMKTFTKLADAELAVAGPLSIASTTLVALDGKLTQLEQGALVPLADDHNVVCLGEQNGLTYACEREGISRVSDQVVGEPVFRFGWVEAPVLERVAEGEPRMLCNAQWQDFLLDMQLAMLEFSNVADASLTVAVSAQPAAAGASASAVSTPQAPHCSSSPTPLGAKQNTVGAYLFGIVLLLLVRRHRASSVSR